jgi:magnesium transporter
LLGVVNAKEVGEAVRKNASRTMLKIAGIFGGEELRSMPMTSRAGMRLSWLIANLVLSLLSAGVIALYEDTLAKIIVLAAFLPVVSNMSGNVGIQSIGLSLRELALGITRPRDLRYVLSKELGLSVLNGLVLGTVLAAVGYIWQGDGRIGLVVGLAMMLNIVIAGCLGGVLPLLLKRLRLDPALSSGPILTTISDMCGFFLVLSLAALALRWLH